MSGRSLKTILLTGNEGYIGPVMTEMLHARGYAVIGLDAGWFADNTFFSLPQPMLPERQIRKDIRAMDGPDLDGIDAVIHLAGLSNDPLGEIDRTLTDDINYRSTERLAGLCKKASIKRFIFASSCSIYGIAPTDAPITEAGAVNPITAYAKAKVDAELALSRLAGDSFCPVLLRNATVYGLSPRLRLDLVVNNLLAGAFLTNEVSIMSDGTPWRPIVHIRDFCAAFVAALEAPPDSVCGEAFNVGLNEENYQVKEIADAVAAVLPGARVKILNKTGSDERTYRVDFSKIRKALPSFKPEWNVKKGIGELLDAYRKYGLTLKDFESQKYFRIRTVKEFLAAGAVDRALRWTGSGCACHEKK